MLDPHTLVEWGGYAGLALIVLVETGLPVGFFLPGDSLLVAVGFVGATGRLDLVTLNVLLIAMAIAGDATGYLIGRRMGETIFQPGRIRWIRREHLIRTQLFYEEHGGKTIVLARFIPIIRTFAPLVAGVSGMPYRRFAVFNVGGAIGWVVSLTLTGYLLGTYVPEGLQQIELLILGVVAVSLVPPLSAAWNERRRAGRRRTVFGQTIQQLADVVLATPWEWTTAGMERVLRTLAVWREATAILRDDDGREQLAVSVQHTEGGVASLDIIAASVRHAPAMSTAAREAAAIEIGRRFEDALEALRRLAGRECAPAHGAPAAPAAAWPLQGGTLLLLQRVRGDRCEICLPVEPPGWEERISA